jgi:UPF0755 protein
VKRLRYTKPIRDVLLVALATAISFLAIEVFCQAGWHETRYVYVIIEEGLPFSEITNRVVDAGLVKAPSVFLALGRLLGIEHRAGAGRYRFERSSDMASVLRTLYSGVSFREQVRVPAGLIMETVAHVLSSRAGVDSTQFMTFARDSSFMATLGVPSVSAEGYLFPDTYDIEWDEDPAMLIRRMVGRFYRAFDDSLRERSREIGLSVNEATTLASIIEKEAMLESEKPRISAVFHNRLRRGMRLQADPTVRYALGKWRGRVLYKDLDVPSPFNTYYVYGLPPHPICNPERSSIVAALYPVEGSKDLYFVATGDGSHTFTHSGSDHNKAKAEYKKFLEEQARAEREAEEAARAAEEGDAPAPDTAAPGKELSQQEAGKSGAR